VGQGAAFDLSKALVAFNNLGGLGPDVGVPAELRYTNVGQLFYNGGYLHFDLVVSNRSKYTAQRPYLNGKDGDLASIDVGCGTNVDLRVTVTLSCNVRDNCGACSAISDRASRTACFEAGCSCFGVVVNAESYCSGAAYEARRRHYKCPQMYDTALLNTDSLTLTLYDMDGYYNVANGYVAEVFTLSKFSVYKTPLRAGDGSEPASNIMVEEFQSGAVRFTSTAIGRFNDPVDVYNLSPTQAAKGVQAFIPTSKGYLDGNFEVKDTGVISGYCSFSRQFLIGGDSGLCDPPPSSPPLPTSPPVSPSPSPCPPPPPNPRSPPPSPPPSSSPVPPTPPGSPPSAPPPCTFDMTFLSVRTTGDAGRRLKAPSLSVCDYSLVVEGDAAVASKTHNGAFAIGGKLTDASPGHAATVGGHSYVHRTTGGGEGFFTFVGGYTSGTGMPFDWIDFEHLARVIQPIDPAIAPHGHHVFVLCEGGRYGLSDLYKNLDPNLVAGRSGRNTLVVFNTAERVTLGASRDGRQFLASVLAPFSEVVIEDMAGYVDGFVVAKTFTMNSGGSSVEIHGRCFEGASSGITCGDNQCSAINQPAQQPAQPCIDKKPSRKCSKKQKKGKCSKKKFRTVQCRLTCGDCT